MVSFNTCSRKMSRTMQDYFWYLDFFIKYIHISSLDFPPKGLAQQLFIMKTGQQESNSVAME